MSSSCEVTPCSGVRSSCETYSRRRISAERSQVMTERPRSKSGCCSETHLRHKGKLGAVYVTDCISLYSKSHHGPTHRLRKPFPSRAHSLVLNRHSAQRSGLTPPARSMAVSSTYGKTRESDTHKSVVLVRGGQDEQQRWYSRIKNRHDAARHVGVRKHRREGRDMPSGPVLGSTVLYKDGKPEVNQRGEKRERGLDSPRSRIVECRSPLGLVDPLGRLQSRPSQCLLHCSSSRSDLRKIETSKASSCWCWRSVDDCTPTLDHRFPFRPPRESFRLR